MSPFLVYAGIWILNTTVVMAPSLSHAVTHVGLMRSNNEDAIYEGPELELWLVADGMGGHAAGEVASAIAIETIVHKVSNGFDLASAVQASHKAILAAAEAGQGGKGMGSTVVGVQSNNREYNVAWVGDSRLYSYSPLQTPHLQQVTTDHSYVQLLFQSGYIDETQIDNHPEKNVITQCLGSTELEQVNVDKTTRQWLKNERLVMCSDGLSDYVSQEEITRILSVNTSLQEAANKLVQAALKTGGKDNISVVILQQPATTDSWLKRLFKKRTNNS